MVNIGMNQVWLFVQDINNSFKVAWFYHYDTSLASAAKVTITMPIHFTWYVICKQIIKDTNDTGGISIRAEALNKVDGSTITFRNFDSYTVFIAVGY